MLLQPVFVRLQDLRITQNAVCIDEISFICPAHQFHMKGALYEYLPLSCEKYAAPCCEVLPDQMFEYNPNQVSKSKTFELEICDVLYIREYACTLNSACSCPT